MAHHVCKPWTKTAQGIPSQQRKAGVGTTRWLVLCACASTSLLPFHHTHRGGWVVEVSKLGEGGEGGGCRHCGGQGRAPLPRPLADDDTRCIHAAGSSPHGSATVNLDGGVHDLHR